MSIAYYSLLTGEPYCELGKDYLEQRQSVSREQLAVKSLRKLGYTVIAIANSCTEEQEKANSTDSLSQAASTPKIQAS